MRSQWWGSFPCRRRVPGRRRYLAEDAAKLFMSAFVSGLG